MPKTEEESIAARKSTMKPTGAGASVRTLTTAGASVRTLTMAGEVTTSTGAGGAVSASTAAVGAARASAGAGGAARASTVTGGASRRSTMRRSTVKSNSRSTAKNSVMDFDYVVQRKEKGKVCFGSGLERKFLDFDTNGLVSKHARCNTKQTFDNVGPGSYDIGPLTSALSKVLNQKTSILGTVLGGRRAARGIDRNTSLLTPGPIYDIPTTFPTVFKQCCTPFNVSGRKTEPKMTEIPGVGTYRVRSYKCRTTAFYHSFGGKKCLIPAVKIKCDPYFSDICEKCGQTPEGDYWYLDMIENAAFIKTANKTVDLYLCRPCYILEKKEPEVFSKGQIKRFKKIRNCSDIHYHGGCKAKLLLVSPAEIKKVREREGYFASYFS